MKIWDKIYFAIVFLCIGAMIGALLYGTLNSTDCTMRDGWFEATITVDGEELVRGQCFGWEEEERGMVRVYFAGDEWVSGKENVKIDFHY